jgi:hypothetical protein
MIQQSLSRDKFKRNRSKPSGGDKGPKKGKDWYAVDAIVGSRLLKGRVELEVKWEGYEETTWENFEAFAKDSPREVEKHLAKSVLGPHSKLLDQRNELEH